MKTFNYTLAMDMAPYRNHAILPIHQLISCKNLYG